MNKSYGDILRDPFFLPLITPNSPPHLEKIVAAFVFAYYGHQGQVRDGGEPYFEHPKAVARMIFSDLSIWDWKYIVLALLHDIMEDSYIMSWQRVDINFGVDILQGLHLLTKTSDDYFDKLMYSGTKRELTVKLCDRLHNVRTLDQCTPEKQVEYLQETETYCLPMAQVLRDHHLDDQDRWRGQWLYSQLEALCNQHRTRLQQM